MERTDKGGSTDFWKYDRDLADQGYADYILPALLSIAGLAETSDLHPVALLN